MNGVLARYYRPPFVGAIAFAGVFLAVPLAHSLGVVVREIIGKEHAFAVFFVMGLIACAMFITGARRNEEVSGTLLGFAAGILIWVGWASYAFNFNQVTLGLPMAEMPGGGKR